MNAQHPARPSRGFTLVEVLVALVIMSVIAAMAWRGVDTLVRSRDAGNAVLDDTLRLQTAVAQWDSDLAALVRTDAIPALAFDGASFSFVRRQPEGLQIVVWRVRQGRWQRYAYAPVTRAGDLVENWIFSQGQANADGPGWLTLDGSALDWQVYYYRNGWSNAQSSDDVAATSPPAEGGKPGGGSGPVLQLPGGVRMVLRLKSGTLTRDVRLSLSQAPGVVP
ncbi:prepilin-type N-terminal cleavage/methylation domain-containing protein [Amphibiibacter pelophylacis]|uniref:Prepilin-type N-terminal cleavage/methylation domain-containing protein n=1 Tax=Amphibiibacter pelophylacis TaxID=1799477 RepID=A0ACC6P4W6_9BURK